jgi:AcrR family transcriptional regulator
MALITERGDASATMAEIASAAKLSRQAVYLHFADRADLLIALVQHVDDKLGLTDDIQRLRSAPTGVAAITDMVAMQARRNPALWAVARALDAVRRTDAAAERSWQDRLDARLQGCRAMIAQLAAEGNLRKGLPAEVATDLLWTFTSLRTWEDLVQQRGWPAEKYQRHMTQLLLEALTEG